MKYQFVIFASLLSLSASATPINDFNEQNISYVASKSRINVFAITQEDKDFVCQWAIENFKEISVLLDDQIISCGVTSTPASG